MWCIQTNLYDLLDYYMYINTGSTYSHKSMFKEEHFCLNLNTSEFDLKIIIFEIRVNIISKIWNARSDHAYNNRV